MSPRADQHTMMGVFKGGGVCQAERCWNDAGRCLIDDSMGYMLSVSLPQSTVLGLPESPYLSHQDGF
jgi:hypothetical protein